MSNANTPGRRSSVPPLYESSSHRNKYGWLYQKPALKVRTQERFNVEEYLKRRIPVPKTVKNPWWLKLYQRNPRRFLIGACLTSCTFLYSRFLFDLLVVPAEHLVSSLKEVVFQPPVSTIEPLERTSAKLVEAIVPVTADISRGSSIEPTKRALEHTKGSVQISKQEIAASVTVK